jgi:prepilin-type processing-associated H-X9-DG protein
MAQSDIAIMWDRGIVAEGLQFSHIPGGANVLYMDGHVKFLRYPTRGVVPVDVPCFLEIVP